IKQLRNGIKGLLRQNKITHFNGFGTVFANKKVVIESEDSKEEIQAKNIILANGSKPFVPRIPGLEHIEYHTSDTIFDITEVPERLVIMGGGVIGLEIACVFNSLGTSVEI